MEGSFVSSNTQGVELRGSILRLGRFEVVFENYQPGAILRTSQVLNEFKVFLEGDVAYSGRAVVSNLMHTGAVSICEAKLDEPGVQLTVETPNNGSINVQDAYKSFYAGWEKQMKVSSEFKLAVSDLQSYLWDLKLLLEGVEVSILGHPSRSRSEIELQVSQELAGPVLSAIDAMHERFEVASEKIPDEARNHYSALVRRQLHPMFLCSPFGYRTYHKPLGYAGDYEIMNMIHRNTFEGASLYAKIVHYWLVNQWAAKSVRNRVARLKTKVIEEVTRAVAEKRTARILNLGCGPAREVQEFILEHAFADHAEFTLLDFDSETVDYLTSRFADLKNRSGRRTPVQVKRVSVTELIKNSSRSVQNPLGGNFDLIYCGGLFDYLSDRICKQLTALFYSWLAPRGLAVVVNMSNHERPFSNMVEFLLDWHLLYRNSRCMESFAPDEAPADCWSVVSEPVAINLFLEVRKPEKN